MKHCVCSFLQSSAHSLGNNRLTPSPHQWSYFLPNIQICNGNGLVHLNAEATAKKAGASPRNNSGGTTFLVLNASRRSGDQRRRPACKTLCISVSAAANLPALHLIILKCWITFVLIPSGSVSQLCGHICQCGLAYVVFRLQTCQKCAQM